MEEMGECSSPFKNFIILKSLLKFILHMHWSEFWTSFTEASLVPVKWKSLGKICLRGDWPNQISCQNDAIANIFIYKVVLLKIVFARASRWWSSSSWCLKIKMFIIFCLDQSTQRVSFSRRKLQSHLARKAFVCWLMSMILNPPSSKGFLRQSYLNRWVKFLSLASP